jgi:hypothetical protein
VGGAWRISNLLSSCRFGFDTKDIADVKWIGRYGGPFCSPADMGDFSASSDLICCSHASRFWPSSTSQQSDFSELEFAFLYVLDTEPSPIAELEMFVTDLNLFERYSLEVEIALIPVDFFLRCHAW